MTPRILVARADAARKRIAQAVAEMALAKGIQVDSLDAFRHRDPAINGMLQLEAIAEALEMLGAVPAEPEPAEAVAEVVAKPRGRPRKETANDD